MRRSVCLVMLLLCAAAAPTSAQTIELSGTFTPPIVGYVESLYFPGNGRVVYYTGYPGAYFSVPLDGSAAPIEIGPLGGRSIDFSADGSRAVYFAGGVFGSITTVLTDGSAGPIAIDSFLIEDISNYHPDISADGQWVLYQETEEMLQLRSARADGSDSPVVLFSGYAPLHEFSPDGTRVFYRSNNLFMVPVDGSAASLQLNPAPVAGGAVSRFVVSPDGARIVYTGDTEQDGVVELFSVPSDGSASPIKLSATMEGGVSSSYGDPRVSSNGRRVVYLADQDVGGKFELYGVPIDGGASPVKLSGSLAANRDVTAHQLTPDGRRVLFLADRDVDQQFELHLASTSGAGAAVQINAPLVSGGQVGVFAVSADSRYAIYWADQAQDGVFELYSVPIGKLRRSGTSRVMKLNLPLVAGASVLPSFQLVGSRVVYTISMPDGDYESFNVPIEGGASIALTPDFGPHGVVWPVKVSPEGVAVFKAIPGAALGERVFSEPLDASSAPIDLSGPLGFGWPGEVGTFLLTRDGERAVYLADEDVQSVRELHAVPTSGALPALELSGTMPPPELNPSGVTEAQMSADGARVAYLARQDGDTQRALYEGPIDGSLPAAKRSGSEGEALSGFAFDANGDHLVYRAAVTPSTQGLYSVRADGSLPPTRLNVAGGGDQVHQFALSSSGGRVIYLSDELANGKLELFTVPANASATRVRLHGSVASNRDVILFAIDPTGQRVAYTADHGLVDNAFDLYSVPIDASAAPIRLNAALVPGREVRALRFSPDGQRVVYTVDQDGDELIELFSAPLDGSAPAVKLNLPPVTNGDIFDFEVDPDGARVVYRSDQDTDNDIELYSVPLDGSTAPIRLNLPLAPGVDVGEFRLAREVVVFTQLGSSDGELYSVPLDGSTSARHLSGGAAVGRVGLFTLDGAGTRVVFTTTPSPLPDGLFTVPLDGRHAPELLGSFESIEQLALTADGARVVHRSNAVGEYNAVRLLSTRLPRLRSEKLP